MQTSVRGISFIADNEGLVLAVEGDAGGKQVIGYGHDLLPGESYPNGIDEPGAYKLLLVDVAKWDLAISALGWTLTQNQHDALCDFTHECGVEALRELAAHGISQIAVQLPRWVHAHVKGVLTELPGMVARRAKDVQLFNTA